MFARSLGYALCLLAGLGAMTAAARAQDEVDISDKLALCATCHGEDGMPTDDTYPIIWGQQLYYLYVQLKDYAAGRRQHDIMTGIAGGLTKDEMQALAMHYSKQPWPTTTFRASDAATKTFRQAAASGQCTQCHLSSYKGSSRLPRTAGQQPKYLEQTMLDLKYDRRQNAAAMASLMEGYSDAEIKAMAEHLAALN